jgi:hypothetical protein
VEALGIVDSVDEDSNGTPCLFEILEAAAICFVGFEFVESFTVHLIIVALGVSESGIIKRTVIPLRANGRVRKYHTWIIFLAAFRGQSPNVSPDGTVESALNGSVRPALQSAFFET